MIMEGINKVGNHPQTPRSAVPHLPPKGSKWTFTLSVMHTAGCQTVKGEGREERDSTVLYLEPVAQGVSLHDTQTLNVDAHSLEP